MIVTIEVTPRPGADERAIAEAAAARVWEMDAVQGCELLAEPPPADARHAAEVVLRIRRALYGDDPGRRGDKALLDAAACCMHVADLKTWHKRMERAILELSRVCDASGKPATRTQILNYLDNDELWKP